MKIVENLSYKTNLYVFLKIILDFEITSKIKFCHKFSIKNSLIKVDAFELFRLEFEQNHQLNAQLLIDADHYNTNEPPKTKKSKTDGSNLIGLFRQIYNEKRALIGHLMARLSMVTMDEKKMRWIFGLSGGECDDTIKNILSSLNDVNQTSWCDYKVGIATFY